MKSKNKKDQEVTVKTGVLGWKAFQEALPKLITPVKKSNYDGTKKVLWLSDEAGQFPHYIAGIDSYEEESEGSSLGISQGVIINKVK